MTTRDDISPETAEVFAAEIYFAFHEGRYHQVKRMFHALGNQVLSLHRERIG